MSKKKPAPAPDKHVECNCLECQDRPLLENVEDDYIDGIAEWVGGCWQLARPTDPGIYAVATLEGDHVGYRELKMRNGDLIDTLQAVNQPGWCGQWWSVRLPHPAKQAGDLS
jgi:hypothetical protein